MTAEPSGGSSSASTALPAVTLIEAVRSHGDQDFWVMALEGDMTEVDYQCAAMTRGGHMVTLDSASDGHVAPIDYAKGCQRFADSGPVLRDAQRQVIPFAAEAVVPMAVLGGDRPSLLKTKMRLSDRISKPIVSLCKLMDGGAEFWLSKHSGMFMQLGNEWIPIHRVNDSLALEVKAYEDVHQARRDTLMVAAAGAAQGGDARDPSAASSGSGAHAGGQPVVPVVQAQPPAAAVQMQPLGGVAPAQQPDGAAVAGAQGGGAADLPARV